ncbi:EAL domain-containing protein [Sulfurimonas crateris]|uniref:EAL domain-containing protein n=1 Tax=Sulfurimonas crateris TaxID=2574727 RepID=A0A4U2Z5D7_9BACT|nr:EAL domain-containing protein [Sulfurimonas crateris]TKI69005.1 EAL domain-containing protein [Sulfurimonas crateris]
MRLVNYNFEDLKKLDAFIDDKISKDSNLLIQLLSGEINTPKLQLILELLTAKLPKAKIIGASTSGEIVNGKIQRNTIEISFSIFENTSIETYYYPEANFDFGVKAAKSCIKDDTKAVIAFSEALKGDSESFLNGFTTINHDVIFAGGNAGDNLEFKTTFVIKDKEIYFDGIVLATLNSNTLHVSNNYSLEWTPIGREMIVTKSDKNIIYEIDNKPAKEIFSRYLGEETISNLPASAIEFPLVRVENNIIIARSMVGVTPDDGFIFAGHFNNGDRVRFAIGNIEEILNNASKIQNKIAKKPVEATYIYSCAARDLFLKEQLNYEFGLIEDIAPTVGMFTYGEFFHTSEDTKFLNITTTTLSISETDNKTEHEHIANYKHKQSMLKSLTHLVNASQDELDESISILNQYKRALDASSIVSKTDAKGVIIYVNDAFCRISGYSRAELIGKKHNIIKHDENDLSLFKDMWRTITNKQIWRGTIKNISKQGNAYYVKTVIMPILGDDGELVEYIAARTDVTELIEKDEIIKKQFTDELTSLQNREALLRDLDLSSKKSTLALINIDRFSDINDYFGYNIGDKVLKELGKIIKNSITKEGQAYRLSGDEFAVLYFDQELGNDIKVNLENLIQHIENTNLEIDGYNIAPIISCGVSSGEKQEAYKLSHVAIKESKVNNKKILIYDENEYLKTQMKNNIEVIDSIKLGIKEDRFLPFYQGIVDNKTKKIVKYEALIRLKGSDDSIISPYFFLEHAKKAKLYNKLTLIMIEKSFKRFSKLKHDLSINLCLQDISSKETIDALIANLKKYKCGNRVVIEIVESEGIENFKELDLFIKEVKKYGCKIAIDDFGTGYSNFSYLAELNIDYIKIDGSLVNNIDKDIAQRITVESILLFAKNMNIKTIAEFVETENIYNTLVELGVDYSQGYLFSEPCQDI